MNVKNEPNAIGSVQSVDTGSISVKINEEKLLNSVQVNQIVTIRSTKTGEKIIGLISKIMRRAVAEKLDSSSDPDYIIENVIKVNLVGTLISIVGTEKNVFKRTLNTVPSIDADCFLLKGEDLTSFMSIISSDSKNPLKIGKYTISEESDVNLDGNKFFQRHAVIVGGTGSGKSWTVANILDKATALNSVNCIVLDLHGEYKPLKDLPNTTLLKIAGPSDSPSDVNVIFLPYWLLSYEENEAMLLDRSDSNAPNQSRTLFDLIIKYKREKLENDGKQDVLDNFTIDSPVPYKISDVLTQLEFKDKEETQPGARADKPKVGH